MKINIKRFSNFRRFYSLRVSVDGRCVYLRLV
ncbi:hypothetical protein Goshw_027176 [Gossypium schwendimanii]|uniref:Uncharacterized protein n=1 Tax=Gossypium schwendimanii TaxID=34291 RepID=A0A7J9MYW1_GOSSC|nr:hypothetical protein [Gossypium schwendimanii]